MNMRPWKGITTTLEAYECWHGAMAGMVEVDNGGWHRMDWYISFIALFSYWCVIVFSIACFFPTGDEKVDHIDLKCIFICTSVGCVCGTVGLCMLQVFFTMAGFEACSETGMFTIVWLCINWFVNSNLTMERNFSLETALVNVQWIGDFICS